MNDQDKLIDTYIEERYKQIADERDDVPEDTIWCVPIWIEDDDGELCVRFMKTEVHHPRPNLKLMMKRSTRRINNK